MDCEEQHVESARLRAAKTRRLSYREREDIVYALGLFPSWLESLLQNLNTEDAFWHEPSASAADDEEIELQGVELTVALQCVTSCGGLGAAQEDEPSQSAPASSEKKKSASDDLGT